ncbi:MAG: CDP-diacylglycerol---glycerol-3-phosphate 3-phosphatidyltransferase [Chloroflexota bacterium]|jgi:CDP-diacylglycerol--glycerol-3-phosphate 3-phosphatidyltransferase|nr:CDP-diacylglycerol---glycerol-3-phosphate 3-phosphatidyltransferase [Chloroflexota bacterium]
MSVVPASLRARVRSTIERPVAGIFGRLGFSPNALTLVGFAIAIVGAYFAARQSWLIAGLIVAFGAVFDLFDGALARATGSVSKFGAFLDSTFDRLGESVVYIGIFWGLDVARDIEGATSGGGFLAITAMAASLMVSYVRARAEGLGFSPGTGMASVGFAPREVRMLILVVGLVLTGLVGGVGTMHYPNEAASIAMYGSLLIITVLSLLTVIQRILFTYRQSKSQEVSK